MFKVNIFCVGSLKENFYLNFEAEFKKRLSKFCETNVVEVVEKSNLNMAQKIEKESEELLKKIKGDFFLLDIEGKLVSSVDFSQLIEEEKNVNGFVNFVIGGSNGVNESFKCKAKKQISFGKITLPHNLVRNVLFEQIYRAFCIMMNTPYHK